MSSVSLLTKNALKDSTTGVLRSQPLALNSATSTGVMGSTATSTAATTFTIASFTGPSISPAGTGRFGNNPRNITISGAAATGAYATGASKAIVVTGTRAWDGATVSESWTVTGTSGPVSFTGVVLYDGAITVYVPPQLDATGAWTFGVGQAAMATGTCSGAVTNTNNHRDSGGGSRGVYVGTCSGACNVYAVHYEDDGNVVARKNVAAGTEYPWWIQSIHENTTATDLLVDK